MESKPVTPSAHDEEGRTLSGEGGKTGGKTLYMVVTTALAIFAVAMIGASALAQQSERGQGGSSTAAGQAEACKDPSDDPAGCQPSTFDTPIDRIPGGRVDRAGNLDPTSSERHAHAGAFQAAKKEGLFRNFEWVHWVVTVPSEQDPETGEWSGGDLDGEGDGRGLAVSGDCIFFGHRNAGTLQREIDIFRIQPNPERDAPVRVGGIPAMVQEETNFGFDDRELRAITYTTTEGVDRMLLVREGTIGQDGRFQTFEIDPDTCLPIAESDEYVFDAHTHEFFLWHDPNNPNRLLVFVSMFSGVGRPDPHNPGELHPDLSVLAATDEDTGEILPEGLRFLAGHTLELVGGPEENEFPDETGLFSDGRFADFSHLEDSWGRSGRRQTSQWNRNHMVSVLDDGERVYVAHTTAGFYVLNSEEIAHNRNADFFDDTVDCNRWSTNVWVDGELQTEIDIDRVPEVANDCLRQVINDDPGVQMLLAREDISDQEKVRRYMDLKRQSRLNTHPNNPIAFTGIHSAVFIPNRPSQSIDTEGRPAYVWLTEEGPGCPLGFNRVVDIQSEVTPSMIGAFAIPDVVLDNCLTQATTEPDGTPKPRRVGQFNHNPTAFENMVFVSWYGHGVRAVDISIPHNPREVGHAITVPWTIARTYPIFHDGLIYWGGQSGLIVAKYTGPRADELPGPGDGVFEGNATSPHR